MRKWDHNTIELRIDSAIGIIMYAEQSKAILYALDLASCDVDRLYHSTLYICRTLEELRDISINLLIEKSEFYEDLRRN